MGDLWLEELSPENQRSRAQGRERRSANCRNCNPMTPMREPVLTCPVRSLPTMRSLWGELPADPQAHDSATVVGATVIGLAVGTMT